jgi:hypothetical protein
VAGEAGAVESYGAGGDVVDGWVREGGVEGGCELDGSQFNV